MSKESAMKAVHDLRSKINGQLATDETRLRILNTLLDDAQRHFGSAPAFMFVDHKKRMGK